MTYAGFNLSNLEKFSYWISQVTSKTMRKQKETLTGDSEGRCLEQGVPSGGLWNLLNTLLCLLSLTASVMVKDEHVS